jgi:hypothetical protein
MDRPGGAIEGGGTDDGLSRRVFLQRAGMLGAALATIDFAALLDSHGLLAEAQAQSADLTRDTLNGLIAFMLPGDDEYSIAQGERADGPGGIAAGGVGALIHGLDHYVPTTTVVGPNATLPASGGVAALLNQYAGRVNPAALAGGFPSHFSRLPFADKARVFELFEAESAAENSELRFVAGILPGFSAFLAFSETGQRDLATNKLTGPAVGWGIAKYGGPAEGHRELRGYWRGHKSALDPERRRRRRRRRRERRRRRRRRN